MSRRETGAAVTPLFPAAREGAIPEWTLGWRLNRALGHAGMSTQEMADYLGLSRGMISRFVNDRGRAPRIGYVRLWAERTGVSLQWLLDGTS
jgi:transcriptional regulator with XRE-family HTH domain